MNTTTNTRGVSEAMVERAYDAFLRRIGAQAHYVLSKLPRHEAVAAMRAALSAPEPAAFTDEDRVLSAIDADPGGAALQFAEPAAQGEDESRQLREILAIYVAGPMLYTDDGELSDSTRAPCIDFLRDLADTIARKLADRSRTAPPAQPAERVPKGWVLVPREPTEEMLVAGLKEADPIGELVDWKAGVSDVADPATRDDLSAIYAAMLTASPAPSDGGKGVDRG